MATEPGFLGKHPTARAPRIDGAADATGTGQIMPTRASRISWYVQNNSANALTVTMATSAGGTTKIVLKAATAADTGDGGTVSIPTYKGPVTIAGTSPKYNWQEIYG